MQLQLQLGSHDPLLTVVPPPPVPLSLSLRGHNPMLMVVPLPPVPLRPSPSSPLQTVQMTGGSRNIVYGECDPSSLKPSISWLRQALLGPGSSGTNPGGSSGTNPGGSSGTNPGGSSSRIKMVAIVNPNNPTGVLLTKEELQEIADVCAQAKCWLVSLSILRKICCLLLFPPGACPLGLVLSVIDLIRLSLRPGPVSHRPDPLVP